MEHDATSVLLDDLAEGRLDPARRALAEAHVAGCPDCQAQLHVIKMLSGPEFRELAGALFDPHPSPEELVAYVLESDDLPAADRARIGRHVRVCPTCRVEADLTRRASWRSGSWWRRIRERFGLLRRFEERVREARCVRTLGLRGNGAAGALPSGLRGKTRLCVASEAPSCNARGRWTSRRPLPHERVGAGPVPGRST